MRYADSISLDTFTDEACKLKPLTRRDEDTLSKRIMFGSEKASARAKEKLVMHNIRFVYKVARYYSGQGRPKEDVIQDGVVGLITAAGKYDYRLQFNSFVSYAKLHVLSQIQRGMALTSCPVSLPQNSMTWRTKVSRASKTLDRSRLGVDDIAELTGWKPGQIEPALVAMRTHTSLDTPAHREDGAQAVYVSRKDLLCEDSAPPCAGVELGDIMDAAQAILERLNERERMVTESYFGIGMEESMTLDEIGAALGVSREAVRLTRNRVLNKIAREHSMKELKEMGGLIGVTEEGVVAARIEAQSLNNQGSLGSRREGMFPVVSRSERAMAGEVP